VLSLATELRFAARRLRRAPGFAATVVLVWALGVGATTAVFGLVDGIVLRPLPFPQPDRLVSLTHTVGWQSSVDQSDATVLLYQDAARAFEGVAAWVSVDGNLGASERDQAAVRARSARVTWNFFDVLGVRPLRGRGFVRGEDRPGANHVVVLSHRVWRERFGGDPGAVGRQVVVNDVVRTIVGVMPERFAYPSDQVELWLPLALDPSAPRTATFALTGIARLGRGVSAASAEADLARVLGARAPVAPQLAQLAPQVRPLRDSIVGPVSHLLWLVFGSVALVLLVACTNVAGLFLVRAEGMQMELAVRRALGSRLAGVFALVLSEALLLGAVAGGAGLLLAWLATTLARSAGAVLALPRLGEVGVDGRVAAFALAVTALCAIGVSLAPLARAGGASLAEVLRGAAAGPAGGRPYREALVVAQVALGVVLVAASGLMTRSFFRLQAVQPGFDPDRVVSASLLLPFARYGEPARLRFFDRLAREVRTVPGVRAVALTDRVPLGGARDGTSLEVEGEAVPASHAVVTVDAPFFETLRIPVLRGRTIEARDPEHPPDEVVVARAFASRHWPGESPLGRRVRPVDGRWHTVVGEVENVHFDALDRPADALVYFPIVRPGGLSLVVRTDAGEGDALAAVRRIARALDPAVPMYDEGSLRRRVDDGSARARALAVLLAAAGVVTALIAGVGLYGIMAYTVGRRRRELGIRMALGARPRDVGRLVSLVGLRLAAVGIALGTAGALLAAPLLRGLLYGVSPTDPVTLAAAALVVFLTALLAAWVPARRAAAVPPSEALRSF
jgi:predicted permease